MLGRSSRILVVDGDEASRNATHRIFFPLGYKNVDYAPDTRTALRRIGQNNYRLILADWDAAPVNGMELLRQTRIDNRMKCLPFLMAVAQWQKKFIEIVRDDGATLYLIKPFTPLALAQRMMQVTNDASRMRDDDVRAAVTERMANPHTSKAIIPELWKSLRPDF